MGRRAATATREEDRAEAATAMEAKQAAATVEEETAAAMVVGTEEEAQWADWTAAVAMEVGPMVEVNRVEGLVVSTEVVAVEVESWAAVA